jgi:hypothetical protein
VSLISRDFHYNQILIVFTTVVEKSLQNLEGSALLRTLREPNSLRRPPVLIAQGLHPHSLFSSIEDILPHSLHPFQFPFTSHLDLSADSKTKKKGGAERETKKESLSQTLFQRESV